MLKIKKKNYSSRYRDVPIQINRIPRIDCVVISHNHYDHLDQQSILDLNKKFGDNKRINWFCGIGTKEWFNSIGIYENVHELNWWQSINIKNIEFVFTPAQHWSMRKVFDKNKALWGSWSMIGLKKRIFFAGDTGYCTALNEIGKKYGPFDLSFIPIGAYHPRWFLSPQHVDPEQAVQIHLDVKSQKSFAIHWGTFPMGKEV
jgi:N-acyl-phosphatidylethanolamine-hydrolysing phospholipase D